MTVLVLCFLKMLVNLTQYRITVRIFNKHKIIISFHYEVTFTLLCQLICPTIVLAIPHQYSTFLSAFYFYQGLAF